MTTGDVVYSLRFSLIKILPEPGFDLGSTAGESCVLTARLHMLYKASDFLGSTSTESSPARPTAKTKMKKVDKEISFSDMAAKTRPMALDFFDDNDYHVLCEDVETLTSGLKTVKEKDREYLKKGMIRLP